MTKERIQKIREVVLDGEMPQWEASTFDLECILFLAEQKLYEREAARKKVAKRRRNAKRKP